MHVKTVYKYDDDAYSLHDIRNESFSKHIFNAFLTFKAICWYNICSSCIINEKIQTFRHKLHKSTSESGSLFCDIFNVTRFSISTDSAVKLFLFHFERNLLYKSSSSEIFLKKYLFWLKMKSLAKKFQRRVVVFQT